jgi:hypothetical protein
MTQNVGTSDEEETRSNKFCCHFPYFWMGCNTAQGYSCWKSKKSKNQPILLYTVFNLMLPSFLFKSTLQREKLALPKVLGLNDEPPTSLQNFSHPFKSCDTSTLRSLSKVRPTPCPGWSKIASAECHGANNVRFFFAHLYCSAWPLTINKDLFRLAHHCRIRWLRREKILTNLQTKEQNDNHSRDCT